MRRVSKIVTPPVAQPVTIAEVGLHLGIFDTEPHEDLLALYIKTATALCEQILQRKLITQTWKMWLDHWPVDIKVFFGDLQSVTHVKYTDRDGDRFTVDPLIYTVDTSSVPGRIVLNSGECWPTDTLHKVNPIEVQFVTGYGATAANVPDDIRNALLLTVAHFEANREPFLVSQGVSSSVLNIPWAAATLLQNHRVWDWVL